MKKQDEEIKNFSLCSLSFLLFKTTLEQSL